MYGGENYPIGRRVKIKLVQRPDIIYVNSIKYPERSIPRTNGWHILGGKKASPANQDH